MSAMADKKKIILIVLSAVSLFVWIKGLGVFSKNKQAKNYSAPPFLKNAQASQPRRTEYKDYKRNPFSAAPVSKSEVSGLSLGGIISDDKELYALINDQIVHVGDTIGVNKVIDIKENMVILNDGTKEIELKLEE